MDEASRLWRRVLYILPLGLLLFTFFLYFSLEDGTNSLKSGITRSTKLNYISDIEYGTYSPPVIFNADRFVHLDLKGAPPKVSYYNSLFPLLSKLGATGILIEYEDMFPYIGELLKYVSAHNAYTLPNIETINLLAEENNLTVIPLVQTFGHLEFLLKLKNFSFLREVPEYPQVICPTHNMTLQILYEMIDQVIQANPKSKMIHIGADEVYHIGKCERCIRFMYEEKISKAQLFLSHVKKIAIYIKTKYPHLKILMWDDEFRDIDVDDLSKSAMDSLIEPVVWKYSSNVYRDIGYDLFNTYSKVFKKLWFASAFKGATGSKKYLTSISHHMANHQSWMKVYDIYRNRTMIQGIFITGWQRYDHFAVLCELLPVGIPSLAYSLSVLLGFNAELYSFPNVIIDVLQCQNPYALIDLDDGIPYCKYPGADILDAIMLFHQFKLKYKDLKGQSRVLGWMGSYNSQHNFSNPDIVNGILDKLTDFSSELPGISAYITDTMSNVYDKYTVSEWQETFVQPVYDDINKMINIANRLLSVNEWPRRPW